MKNVGAGESPENGNRPDAGLINMLVLAHREPIPDGLVHVADALGIMPHECRSAQEARRIFATVTPSIVLLPAFLNTESTLPFMIECMERVPEIQTIMVVERHQINEAAEAMRAGVLDCLFRPFSRERFAKTLASAVRRLGQEVREPDLSVAMRDPARPTTQSRARSPASPGAPSAANDRRQAIDDACLTGQGPAATELRRAIESAAQHRLPVLLKGEAGCGKSYCARLIHALSPQPDAPFHKLDCSALDPDQLAARLENAATGTTFFLDEISDLSPQMQARLVRLIGEDGPAGARLVSATSLEAAALIEDGRLRRDLFYRLCAVEIPVPALRDRRDDVPAIATRLLQNIAAQAGSTLDGFTPEAAEILKQRAWPGNLRQLANLLKNLVQRHSSSGLAEVTPGMLTEMGERATAQPSTASAGQALADDLARAFRGQSLDQIERRIIEAVIQAHGGSVTRAARTLKVAPSTLYRKRELWARADQTRPAQGQTQADPPATEQPKGT